MFEQSILLSHDASKPWKVASLSAELLVIILALIIPLASSNHLPAFHWQNVAVRPALAPPPAQAVVTRRQAATNTSFVAPAPRPMFHYDPAASPRTAQAPAAFSSDAPPSIGADAAGNNAGVGGTLLITPTLAPPPTTLVHPNTPSAPIRVGGSVQMAKLIHKVIPEYPALAKAARISGVVHLLGIIDKHGVIRNLQLIGGQPLLARAAMQAVEEWVYEPTLLNGEPVEVIAPIDVSFTLGN